MYEELLSLIIDAKTRKIKNLVIDNKTFSKKFMEILNFKDLKLDRYVLNFDDYDFAIDILDKLTDESYKSKVVL